jgi:acyl-CoA synthetase (AMP-forming)/AMP-acid ligase II
VLRHRHLTAYVIGTVEFGGADPHEAVLVSVPPYHVAGLANLLSNLYLGRRIVYLPRFDAEAWVRTVRAERITHAMVVPTMLARICDVLDPPTPGGDAQAAGRDADAAGGVADAASEGSTDGAAGGLPSLRALSYGGARTPAGVLRRVMELLPEVALTNAYGLTETSSTIAVLGPEDHRAARDGDPVAVARVSSAGRVLPTVEVQVRGPDGTPLPAGETGEIWVRGEHVSGEYAGQGNPLDAEGWFPTRDRGHVDADGYLFVDGRSDDTIIRGGENVAPAEIEDVLLRHPDVAQCAVVGIPDEEWGQRIAAVVVTHPGADLDEATVRDFVRQALRSSKTPDQVSFVDALPYTETGKLLRRVVRDDLLRTG